MTIKTFQGRAEPRPDRGLRRCAAAALAIAAVIGLAQKSYGGTLPDGVIVCATKIDAKRAILAAMNYDRDTIDKMIGQGGPCRPAFGDLPFEMIEGGKHASLVKITLPEGDTVDLWAPSWAAAE